MSYTHLVLLIDRSGSMSSTKDEMESALHDFLTEQKRVDGKCTVTVYTFDQHYDNKFEIEILSEQASFKNINEIQSIVIEPRGGTPLHDAICIAIDREGQKLASMVQHERPERVVFITITDGGENASRIWKAVDVRNRISHQESNYSWKFVYLGSNQVAEDTANSIGVHTSSAITYNSPIRMSRSLNKAVTNVRSCSSEVYGKYVTNELESFDTQDKAEQTS